MKTREAVVRYCQGFPNVFEDYPFEDKNWTCMRIRGNRRIFAWIYEREGNIWVNVSVIPSGGNSGEAPISPWFQLTT